MGILRLLFAVAVMLQHTGQFGYYFPLHGDTAVQAFFVVSGFYIALVYNNIYSRYDGAPVVFWANRYLRLAPLYILVAVGALATNGFAMFRGVDPTTLFVLAVSHITMVGQDIWAFLDYDTITHTIAFPLMTAQQKIDGAGPGHIMGWALLLVPQGWSIGSEMWFYLIAPLLVTRRPRVIAALCAATFVARFGFYGITKLTKDPWNYHFIPFELGIFLLGVLAWHGYEALRRRPHLMRYAPWVLTGLVILTLAYHYLPGGNQERRFAFILLLACGIPFVFALTRDWAIDRMIGDLSYPIYIVHMLVLSWVQGPWALVLSAAVAIAAVFLVERPIDHLRHTATVRLAHRADEPVAQEAA